MRYYLLGNRMVQTVVGVVGPDRRSSSWNEPVMDADFDHADEDLWVFGYGSLIWRPGFPFVERVPAHIVGMHRSLCIYSFDHRGTPQQPGLVLGLDFGGACRGIAYRVVATERLPTLKYLRGREQTTAVYRESRHGIWLAGRRSDGSRRYATWSIAATLNMPAA